MLKYFGKDFTLRTAPGLSLNVFSAIKLPCGVDELLRHPKGELWILCSVCAKGVLRHAKPHSATAAAAAERSTSVSSAD